MKETHIQNAFQSPRTFSQDTPIFHGARSFIFNHIITLSLVVVDDPIISKMNAHCTHPLSGLLHQRISFCRKQTKYDRVVGGLVHRGAFQLTVEGALYSVINQGHATVKAAERMARQLLESMEVGPAEKYDDDDGNRGTTRGASNHAPPARSPGGGVPRASKTSSSVGYSSEDAQQGGQDEKHSRSSGEGLPAEAVAPDGANNNDVWAAPRPQQAGFDIVGESSSGTKDPPLEATQTTTTIMEAPLPEHRSSSSSSSCKANEVGAGSGHNDDDLTSCLSQVRETHRKACTRYDKLVAELEESNASLAAAAAGAVKEKAEALVQAKEWEARYIACEERLAEAQSRSRDELALAEERASDANGRALEATRLMNRGLEKATPTLVDMVATFVPRDTAELGLDLFQKLGIDPDLYAHLLATKIMFKVWRIWQELS